MNNHSCQYRQSGLNEKFPRDDPTVDTPLNMIPLRADLQAVLDAGKFVFAVKDNHFVVHFLYVLPTYSQMFHNIGVNLERTPVALLWCRFALALFKSHAPFLPQPSELQTATVGVSTAVNKRKVDQVEDPAAPSKIVKRTERTSLKQEQAGSGNQQLNAQAGNVC